jgi:hypothetical protein
MRRRYEYSDKTRKRSSNIPELRLYREISKNKINFKTIENDNQTVGLEVPTAVFVKSCIFCDMTPCSPLKSTNVSEKHVTFIFRVEE